LHGLRKEAAVRRLARELHACRVRGAAGLLVVCGRGWGSPGQRGVLGPAVRAWLDGPEARALGVRGVKPAHKGGAFELRLGR